MPFKVELLSLYQKIPMLFKRSILGRFLNFFKQFELSCEYRKNIKVMNRKTFKTNCLNLKCRNFELIFANLLNCCRKIKRRDGLPHMHHCIYSYLVLAPAWWVCCCRGPARRCGEGTNSTPHQPAAHSTACHSIQYNTGQRSSSEMWRGNQQHASAARRPLNSLLVQDKDDMTTEWKTFPVQGSVSPWFQPLIISWFEPIWASKKQAKLL